MSVAIYPGSFDPITNGHINIIKRACKIFDRIIVSIMQNPEKRSLFSIDERLEFIKIACKNFSNVQVDTYSGLTVDYAREKKTNILIRGIRSISNFEYEMQMSQLNKELNNNIETIFIPASKEYVNVSSSFLKQIALMGGDVSMFIPDEIANKVKNKIKRCL